MPSVAVVDNARLPVHQGALRRLCDLWADSAGLDVTYAQVDDEASAMTTVSEAVDAHDGVILNAHDLGDSAQLAEFVRGVDKAIVGVDLTGPATYERTLVGDACDASIHGRGLGGYKWAMTCLADYLAWPFTVVAYGEGIDQTAELRLPAGSGPFPTVVLLHGGSWTSVPTL
jgi:3-dehydroquinate dehydratase